MMVRAAIALLLSFLLASTAAAQSRHALLIGNQGYNAKVGPLTNPHNDIALVGAALKSLAFKVTEVKDADYRTIDAAIKRHVATVRREGQGAISFVYYSGHGAADPDTKINYLIPVDVANADDEDLWHYSLNLNTVVEGLRAQALGATHYVVFDACRNELNLTRKGQKALSDKGFVPIAYTPGVMVAYATAPGRTASDIGRDGGTYAKALADEIVKPGVDSMLVFSRVARRVQREIGQDPFLSASTMPEVYFAGDAVAKPPTIQGGPPLASEAEREWTRVDKASVAELETFLRRHDSSPEAHYARARLDDLKKQIAMAQDEAKRALEAEAARKTAEARRREQDEARKQAELAAAARLEQEAKAAADRTRREPEAKGEPALAQAPVPFRLTEARTVRLQNTFRDTDPIVTPALNTLAGDLTTLSQGTFKVATIAMNAVAPAFAIHDAVSRGNPDAAWSVPIWTYGKHRAVAVFAGYIPFGLEPAAFVRWLDSEGTVLLNELYSDNLKLNVRAIPCGLIGRAGDWYTRRITKPSDLHGLKVSVLGFGQDVVNRAGGVATPLPSGEIVSAMGRGLVNGAIHYSPAMDLWVGLPDAAKVMYFPGWSRQLTLLELIINRKSWEALGNDGQRGLMQLCNLHIRRALKSIPEQEANALAELRAKGVQVLAYPPDVLAAFKTAADGAVVDFRRADPFATKVMQSFDRFR